MYLSWNLNKQRKNKERYERKKHSIFLIICKMGFLSNFVAVYYMLKQLRISWNTMITKPCTQKKTFLEFIVFKD